MDFVFLLSAPEERQTEYGITEMMEFDNEQARFHRANQRRFSR